MVINRRTRGEQLIDAIKVAVSMWDESSDCSSAVAAVTVPKHLFIYLFIGGVYLFMVFYALPKNISPTCVSHLPALWWVKTECRIHVLEWGPQRTHGGVTPGSLRYDNTLTDWAKHTPPHFPSHKMTQHIYPHLMTSVLIWLRTWKRLLGWVVWVRPLQKSMCCKYT